MEAEIKFERENVDGVAVVGSYLIDAERRLGIEVQAECGRLGLCDSCCVNVRGGNEFLSEPTKAEKEVLGDRLEKGDRLSCQAKIQSAGELLIATVDRPDPRTEKERVEHEFKREFETLPLGQKISKLVELEAVTLSETLSFVVNSPFKIGQTVVDALSRFGIKMDRNPNPAETDENTADEAAAAEFNEANQADDAVEAGDSNPAN